jgi:hypothetical protein
MPLKAQAVRFRSLSTLLTQRSAAQGSSIIQRIPANPAFMGRVE